MTDATCRTTLTDASAVRRVAPAGENDGADEPSRAGSELTLHCPGCPGSGRTLLLWWGTTRRRHDRARTLSVQPEGLGRHVPLRADGRPHGASVRVARQGRPRRTRGSSPREVECEDDGGGRRPQGRGRRRPGPGPGALKEAERRHDTVGACVGGVGRGGAALPVSPARGTHSPRARGRATAAGMKVWDEEEGGRRQYGLPRITCCVPMPQIKIMGVRGAVRGASGLEASATSLSDVRTLYRS
ncbi:hypothetical protein THAOC_02353 [Thalassiosira oceanica]|uniref:Uncharacterized protein n=1 Tax=Thalassiosira oceanica TaxID=159749 RepID=K0TQE6_THAOC|nr:hypothetical protein THAOC_02353 [Thalassiosira oceanica]|eukprot:EJK75912.1 hypothetical protein THAOC_02353 [Thalassiosira oceanica]